ncbi:hypothetical protein D9M73_162070 [compost metagenome]
MVAVSDPRHCDGILKLGSSAATGAFCVPARAAVAPAGTWLRFTLLRKAGLVAVLVSTGWTPLEEKLLPI